MLLIGTVFAFAPLLRAAPGPESEVQLLSTNGVVEVLRAGARTWDLANPSTGRNLLYPGDQLRVSSNSFATVQLADRTIKRVGPNGHVSVLAPVQQRAGVRLLRGLFFFLHRNEPGDVQVLTPTVAAVIRGTEFTVEVSENGDTTVSLLDGAVAMTNAFGSLELNGAGVGRASPGQPPLPAPRLEAANAIQWCLYYPAVLDPDELSWPAGPPEALRDSLDAYRQGDLRHALARYPTGRQSASPDERIYFAALLLAHGHVPEATALLDLPGPVRANPERSRRLVAALRQLIAAVKFQHQPPTEPQLATEWLAASYYHQSRGRLPEARAAAQQAVEVAPGFAFARARAAELEFSFGSVQPARVQLDRALRDAPRHAQAMALRGFLLAAENRIVEASTAFEAAIALDDGLANAWLGRGLCRIRRNDLAGGLQDLEVAAALEPQRAVLRSYLGKAFSVAGDLDRAEHELGLAKKMDPNDPTAWLYSALLNQSRNRINEAIRDLESSQARNEQRQVYRSSLLLDQDQATRGANLATLYHDAGLTDVADREAIRAVHDDYANYSAHWFLANSYDQLRDPNQVNLRYETPWFSEFLVANLLAPVSAGTLSRAVSEQEYSRLFERDRLGVVSATTYRSSGDWFQSGAQYGSLGDFAYAVEGLYRSENGQRPNQDQEQLTLALHLKQQITSHDHLYFQAIGYDAEAGDLAQYYRQSDANQTLRIEERQEPLLLAGYHHEWTPDIHTLVLGARLQDRLSAHTDTQFTQLHYLTNGGFSYVDILSQTLRYRSELEIYSAEVQQICQARAHRFILGARGQFGEFDTRNELGGFLFVPATNALAESSFSRVNAYGYWHWQPWESIRLISGLSYDRVFFPENLRIPPVSEQELTREQFSPKLGLIWNPLPTTTLRAAYAETLGGVSIDQSVQLEPTQIAGFLQSYRSVIPESAAGSTAVPRVSTAGLALDQKFSSGTYLGLSLERIRSEVSRATGVFEADERDVAPGLSQIFVSTTSTRERLDYDERTLRASAHQLLGAESVVGATYRVSRAELESRFPGVPGGIGYFGGFAPARDLEATLHQVRIYGLFQHPVGFFAGADAVWSMQDNDGYQPSLPGDDFWQFNIHAGWRFLRRRIETRVSLLNVTDRDYRLNPLNLTPELPRERTLALSLRLNF